MKTNRPNRKRCAKIGRRIDRSGTATVEFSFCATIVFFLFMAVLEVARFHVVRHSIDQAVYTGARVGIVPGASSNEVTQAVSDRLSSAGVLSPTITIVPSVITDSTTSVTVRVSAPYQANSWTLPKLFSGVDVTAEMTLDHENVAFNETL